jgi:hypothetical protein
MIMTKLKDLPTLQRLTVAFPSAATLFMVSFDIVMSSILKRSLEEELQQYAHAIICARTVGPLAKEKLNLFLDDHLEREETSHPPTSLPRSQDTLDYITSVLEATEFFAEFCKLMFSRGRTPPHFPPDHPWSTSPERFRIRRALLRFQLYCELFHQPGDSSHSVSDWEERFPEQKLFWTRFEWWEVEECKCIYYLLVFCLKAVMGNKRPESTGEDDQLHRRGLSQLQTFIEDTPSTIFGLSYIRRFLAKALHGFCVVDPLDLNLFSWLRHRYEKTGLAASAKKRRWEPSRCPPVTLESISCEQMRRWSLNPSDHEERCENGTDFSQDVPLQEARSYVRLVGWCFWDSDTLLDWGVITNVRANAAWGDCQAYL